MSGTFPSQQIRKLCDEGAIQFEAPIRPDQIQPSSLDLTLSDEAHSMPGSLLPLEGDQVEGLLTQYQRHDLSLRAPRTLVRGEVYVVKLRERLALPAGVAAYANNKSSTGRIDLQTRVLTNENPRYDKIPAGYKGELWLEIIPKSFDVRVKAGDSLNQAIFYDDREVLDAKGLGKLYAQAPLLYDPEGHPISEKKALAGEALLMTLDLDQEIVGYVAKKSFRPVDLSRFDHDPSEFFEPIKRPKDGVLFLSQGAFYIFSTFEYVVVPPSMAVEMLPYDTSAGEFRAHYAGFFDPGFGYRPQGLIKGTPAVLEVRPYEDDLIVRHRQPVCKMAYEKLLAVPDQLYGANLKSHYAEQRGPRLSKFFRGI